MKDTELVCEDNMDLTSIEEVDFKIVEEKTDEEDSDEDSDKSSKFYCQVCLSYKNKSNLNKVYNLTTCGHTFCRSCLVSYLKDKIDDGLFILYLVL